MLTPTALKLITEIQTRVQQRSDVESPPMDRDRARYVARLIDTSGVLVLPHRGSGITLQVQALEKEVQACREYTGIGIIRQGLSQMADQKELLWHLNSTRKVKALLVSLMEHLSEFLPVAKLVSQWPAQVINGNSLQEQAIIRESFWKLTATSRRTFVRPLVVPINGQAYRIRAARGERLRDGVVIGSDQAPHHPRQDPSTVRVVRSYSVLPDTAARIFDEARRTGESQGQVVDRLATVIV